jgi:multicomponent Na+:H+ antiporter subunit G
MTWGTAADVLSGACLLLGAGFTLTGVIGLLRFRDVLSRMHAATKPQVLGLVLMLAAVALQNPSWDTVTTVVLVAAFQVLTAPASAHMVGRAGYRQRRRLPETLELDELADAVERAGHRDEDVPHREP